MRRFGLALFLTAVIAPAPLAQTQPALQGLGQRQPPRDTPAQFEGDETELRKAELQGRVTNGRTGQPVQRARVVVVNRDGEGPPVSVLTDQNGQYIVTGLVPGRYTVHISKPGFVNLAYGQRRPRQPPTPVELSEGESLRDINVLLPNGGVVTGRVVDETGAPMPLTTVQVFQHVYRQGRRQLVPAGSDRTDDRGIYRIFGLEEGRYYVNAIAPRQLFGSGRGWPELGARRFERETSRQPLDNIGSDPYGYAPTYYPGVTNLAEATQVTVALGTEATGIDFGVRLVETATVGGTVFGPEGEPATSVRVVMIPEGGISTRNALMGARLQPDGRFEIPDVPPGQYTLRAVSRGGRGRSRGAILFASNRIAVDGSDVTDTTMVLRSGATIAGSLVLESGTGLPSELTRVRVVARAMEDLSFLGDPETRVSDDGTFELVNVPDGGRWLRASRLPTGWMLKAVYLDGQDVIDTPLDFGGISRVDNLQFVLSDQVTHLSGSVRDQEDAPLTAFTVIAFPSDERHWQPQSRYIAASRPDQNATYQIEGLPSGEYLLAAVAGVQEGEWFNPQLLRQLGDVAVRIWLSDGESTTLDLTLQTQP